MRVIGTGTKYSGTFLKSNRQITGAM
jgi:hypothetical protein